ncbi:MAG: response regulator [Ignavibacteriaceae bacterium]|nr:response regulator [Ignavibacteriaceae bacterium]
MQIVKIDFLTKYNKLLKMAQNAETDFPDQFCEFLVEEFEFQAVVAFNIIENEKLVVLGRSSNARKAYIKNTHFACGTCKALKSSSGSIVFNSQTDCELQTSEYVIYEGCLHVKINDSEKVLLKIAKKTPFSKTDKEQIEIIGGTTAVLLNIFTGNSVPASSAVNDIITDIAHELRTPTNSIMGFASLLSEDNLTSSQAEYVTTLKDNAYSLLSLINDLIDIAKVEKGLNKPVITNVNIKSFVDEVINLFKDRPGTNQFEFIVSIDKGVPDSFKTDAQRLKYVLMNILTFAMRLTEHGKISVAVSGAAKDKIGFKIIDSSSGIPSNKLKDIYKPFSLAEMGDKKFGNATGLGLVLSKKYLEQLNGEMDILSTLGKGTTYNFTIGVETISPIETQISALPKVSGTKNRVLVVEDDYATSKLLSNYLNKWGYEPTIVNSADQALKAVEKEVFLAVLMDIVLPDTNGFELLKRIREHKNAKNTPVIVCSVEAEQQKAFMMGAVEYFVKPIKYKYLVEVLTSYRLKKDSNILIVDDDVPTLNLVKEAVLQAGYNAIADSRSARVAEVIETMNLDLAIIDLDMPEVNGFELIKKIKSQPKFAKLPIIIYTGKENYAEEIKKIDGLFADLLHKSSSNIEDLADTITQMINRYDEPSTPEEIKEEKGTIKILLVEDYKHSQIIVTRLLKKNNFESIVVVENGLEALEQAKIQKYDLILMDMQMPVMNGFESTEKIRLLPEYKETPIIALTAFAMKGDREKCLQAGATDYIPKPIDSQEFIEKVKFYTDNKVNAGA